MEAQERVTVWQGVALSLDINPAVVTHGAVNSVTESHLLDGLQQYRPRLAAAVEALGKTLRPAFDFVVDGDECLVWLHEFASWVTSCGWWVPQGFATLTNGTANERRDNEYISGEVVARTIADA